MKAKLNTLGLILFVITAVVPGQAQEKIWDLDANDKVTTRVHESGQAAGKIVQLELQNQTDQQLVVDIPTGTVLVPEDRQQARMVTSPTQVVLGPNGVATTPLDGVCVEHGAKVPERGEVSDGYAFFHPHEPSSGAALVPERFSPQDVTELAHSVGIIETAQQLHQEAKLHNDLGPHHLLTVTQRAIWTHREQDSEIPHDRQTIWNDINVAVKQSGGSQTPEQVDELADNLWADVSLVNKTTTATRERTTAENNDSTTTRERTDAEENTLISVSNETFSDLKKKGWTHFGGRLMRWIIADISTEEPTKEEKAVKKIKDKILEKGSELLGNIPMIGTVKDRLEGGLSERAQDVYVTWHLVDEDGNVLRIHIDKLSVGVDGRGGAVPFLGDGNKKGQKKTLRNLRTARDNWLKSARNNGAQVLNGKLVFPTV